MPVGVTGIDLAIAILGAEETRDDRLIRASYAFPINNNNGGGEDTQSLIRYRESPRLLVHVKKRSPIGIGILNREKLPTITFRARRNQKLELHATIGPRIDPRFRVLRANRQSDGFRAWRSPDGNPCRRGID